MCTSVEKGYKDTVDDIIETDGRELARDLENVFITEFQEVQPQHIESAVRNKQQVRSVGSCLTSEICFGKGGGNGRRQIFNC